MTAVHVSRFGKDHWSTFAYIETRCVDHGGKLDPRHMRTNAQRHPLLDANGCGWPEGRGTKLQGYFVEYDAEFLLPDHDDWDCLEDLEAASLLEILSLATGRVRLTEQGMAVAGLLRAHKARGGQYAGFVLMDAIALQGKLIAAQGSPFCRTDAQQV